MRFFHLLGSQHVVLFLFPSLIFILLLAMGLKGLYFRTQDSEERIRRTVHVYPEDIEERKAPFPLMLLLIIVGFVLWAVFYALGIGLWNMRI